MMGIKIAVPLYRNRLSARFEYATEALILETGDGKILSQKNIHFHNRMNVRDRIAVISKSGVSLLVCCRPSGEVVKTLSIYGIRRAEASLIETELEDILDYAKELSENISFLGVCSN